MKTQMIIRIIKNIKIYELTSSKIYKLGVLVILGFFFVSCATVPIIGRKQLRLIPRSEMLELSFQHYNEFVDQNKLSDDLEKAEMVEKVGVCIQKAVEAYFLQMNQSDRLKGFEWEFKLFENDQKNAFCLPGGKVVIYSGILPVTQNEAGLAVVMGHEIAHAVAEHGNERLSQLLLQQLGGFALALSLRKKPSETQQLWMTVFSVGTEVGALLPYSRKHEYEADKLGLIFMAMAGYDPHIAVDFWQNMANSNTDSKFPEFLRTHPLDKNRIAKIKENISIAMAYYKDQPIHEKRLSITRDEKLDLPSLALEWVKVTGGSFEMGDTWGDGDSDEKPLRKVTLGSFKISKYEVTNAEYAQFLNEYQSDRVKNGTYIGQIMIKENNWGIIKNANGWQPASGFENHPVVAVTWYGACEFCRFYNFRLPSEAEWEYAARGGLNSKGYKYSGSNSPEKIAWYGVNSDSMFHKIGQLESNEIGIYDMSGNVFEWCEDCYMPDYVDLSTPKNIKIDSKECNRALRGGSWGAKSNALRISYRSVVFPSYSSQRVGFRCISYDKF